jgi:hypothetical protein
MMLCEGFRGIDPHTNLFRAFSYGRALSAKGDPELVLVGASACRRGLTGRETTRRRPLRTQIGGGMKSGSTSGTRSGTYSRRS